MLGAIIGDIVGSVYEWDNIKTKDFPLFSEKGFFTDDTVMTIAVADALMKGGTPDKFIDSMKEIGRQYPNSGYGGGFSNWLFSDDREPYNSWGNGSAMRVSPCGWAVRSLNEAETLAEKSASVTHNQIEIDGKTVKRFEYVGANEEPDKQHDLREALRAIESTLSKCEKAQVNLREGTSQYTLTKRRIEAFRIASMLIKEKIE